VRCRRRWTVEFTVERSVHRGVRSGRGSDVRLWGDEMGRPVLGQPPSMVVVDLMGSGAEPRGTPALIPRRWARHTRNWQPVAAVTLNPESESVTEAAVGVEMGSASPA